MFYLFNRQNKKNMVNNISKALDDYKLVVSNYHENKNIDNSEWISDRYNYITIKVSIPINKNKFSLNIFLKEKSVLSINSNQELNIDDIVLNDQKIFEQIMLSITNLTYKISILTKK